MTMTPADLHPLLAKLAEGGTLSEDECADVVGRMMDGAVTAAQTGAFLMALRARGETVEELTGAVRAMRARMAAVEAPEGAIDTCGTGGDGQHTLNISTAAAFVAAGAGAIVAKHGNRAQSSKSGSADVLETLGVRLDLPAAATARCIREVGIGFMFAPAHHGALRAVGPVRRELGFRTLFNLTGPLSNPARCKRQLIGVFSLRWLEPMAHTLKALGAEAAWVVHGADNLDEISTTGPTDIATLEGGRVGRFTVVPSAFGFAPATIEDLRGGDAAQNATALRALLEGETGPYRDIVLLNAAAALVVAGRAGDLGEGLTEATAALDSGAAKGKLDQLIALTGALGGAG
jgi:anthranilate phosphoribosyltransferase